ncbi:T9SS type A sorting domain-containing protein [Melioribacter sp. Ez-97]|uniref:T9SS type A sorting domain-containing protein n=1 Tax=Melioribacter sp. Ez-97 TaxID=3423434 RepID=UPI003ED8A03A
MAAGVEEVNPEIPNEFTLSEAYPNPFNPTTKINFSLTKSSNVTLNVYNILGQKIRTLIDQKMSPGTYSATWNGRDDFGRQVSSGVYFIGLESESFRAFRKIVLMK